MIPDDGSTMSSPDTSDRLVSAALIGAAVYYLAPPPYRAHATVLVDFNMEEAWPQVARDPKAKPADRTWARKLEAKPKYVVSTTRRDFPWSNTHHVEGDLTRAVKALKKATPRGVLVGSPTLSAALQRLNLVDEYRFVVHPVVAGHGPFLFSGLQPSLRLKFVAATRLKSGIVALHYRRR